MSTLGNWNWGEEYGYGTIVDQNSFIKFRVYFTFNTVQVICVVLWAEETNTYSRYIQVSVL